MKQKGSKPVETRINSTTRVLNDKPGSSTEKQPTLTDLAERQQPFGANRPTQHKLSHLVLEWIADALLPYNTVENDAFVRLLKTACPRFAVPSAKYLRTCLMPDIYCNDAQRLVSHLRLMASSRAHAFTSFLMCAALYVQSGFDLLHLYRYRRIPASYGFRGFLV